MKTTTLLVALNLVFATALAVAQDKTAPSAPNAAGRHSPPPQAYEDCKGKRAGDEIQHATPEGKVAATCVDSPKGLVARPSQPRGAPADGRKP